MVGLLIVARNLSRSTSACFLESRFSPLLGPTPWNLRMAFVVPPLSCSLGYQWRCPLGSWPSAGPYLRIVVVRFSWFLIEQLHNIGHFPNAICYTSGHCWRDSERLVNPHKVVVHKVQRNRRNVISQVLLRTHLSAE